MFKYLSKYKKKYSSLYYIIYDDMHTTKDDLNKNIVHKNF